MRCGGFRAIRHLAAPVGPTLVGARGGDWPMRAGGLVQPPIEPMYAAPVEQLPAREAFAGGAVCEMKWDGWRVLMFATAGRVYLQSRSGRPLARYFPDVVGYARDVLPPDAVADGELVVWGRRHGRASFALLQRAVDRRKRYFPGGRRAPGEPGVV